MLRRLAVIAFSIGCSISAGSQTHQHGAASTEDGRFNPFVVSGDKAGFYLAYIQRTGGRSNLMLSRSVDGQNFADPVRVNDREGDAVVRNENPPKIAVGPNGDVYVCWADERSRWKGDVRFARSTDSGKTFSPAVTINSDTSTEPAGHAFQTIALDKTGRIYIAWIDERNKKPNDRGAEIWMSTSDDGGRTFSRDRRILADVCECCRIALQTDGTGRLYLSYRTVPREGPMFRDIVVATSSDRGEHFVSSVVSRDGWEINGCPVAGPSLTIDRSGRVTIVWFTAGGGESGVYYAISTDAARSFTPRRPLDPRRKLSKHAHAVAIQSGAVLVGWDIVESEPFTTWGVLDTTTGRSAGGSELRGVSYPIVAVRGDVAVIAGMSSQKHDVVTLAQKMPGASDGDRK